MGISLPSSSVISLSDANILNQLPPDVSDDGLTVVGLKDCTPIALALAKLGTKYLLIAVRMYVRADCATTKEIEKGVNVPAKMLCN